MRKILDQTFKTNLVSGARIIASNEKPGHNASSLIDLHPTSYWMTDEGIESATLEFQLPKEQTFDRLMLQENIGVGQRIEAFRLEVWSGNAWKTIARGTTVGYKRLLRFPAVTSEKVRLLIDSSRTSPTLSSFGLYKSPPR
jgi:alpha-L-fucosidase